MPRVLLPGLLALALLTSARAGSALKQGEVDKIIETARAESRVTEYLDHVANRIGPRLTSSNGLQDACEWSRDAFAALGLENARLEQWGEFPVGFNRGPWSGRVVEPEARSLEFVTASWTAGTKGPVKGKAVLAPINEEELAKLKPSLKGAWVVTPLPAKEGPRPTPAFLKTLAPIYAEAGIAGIVRPSTNELLITDGNYRITWDKLPTIPSIRLLGKQFDEVLAWMKADKPVTLEFDVRNHFKKGPIKLYNVIADLPGTDKSDEYVIVGGHIDSWDGATGTTDNGTGMATTLEAARILVKSGVKPRRTIRFMLWSGEEQGLLGSKAYVKAHPELIPKISAVLVHDGGTNYLSGISATEAQLSEMTLATAPLVGLDAKYPFEVRKVAGLTGGGSDHASFLEKNVPGFFWRQSGTAVYRHTHHTQFDTFDAANPDYQKHSALVAALGSYGIASLDGLLSRDKLRLPGGGAGRRLGVQLDELTVSELTEDGVAEKGGMLPGDVLLKIDGVKIEDRQSMTRAITAGEPKKKVVVVRDGKEVELTLDWGAPPKN